VAVARDAGDLVYILGQTEDVTAVMISRSGF
jgi:hypothetical protein